MNTESPNPNARFIHADLPYWSPALGRPATIGNSMSNAGKPLGKRIISAIGWKWAGTRPNPTDPPEFTPPQVYAVLCKWYGKQEGDPRHNLGATSGGSNLYNLFDWNSVSEYLLAPMNSDRWVCHSSACTIPAKALFDLLFYLDQGQWPEAWEPQPQAAPPAAPPMSGDKDYHNWKVGDFVICTDPWCELVKGNIYRIESFSPTSRGHIYVRGSGPWCVSRFMRVDRDWAKARLHAQNYSAGPQKIGADTNSAGITGEEMMEKQPPAQPPQRTLTPEEQFQQMLQPDYWRKVAPLLRGGKTPPTPPPAVPATPAKLRRQPDLVTEWLRRR